MSRLLGVLLLATALLTAQPVAQDPAAPPQDPALTSESLQARLEATKADTTLAEEARAAAVEALTKAIESVEATKQLQTKMQQQAERRGSVATRLAKSQQELKSLDDAVAGPTQPNLGLAELELGLTQAQQALTAAQQRVSDVGRERARRGEQRTKIPELLTTLGQQLAAMPQQPPEQPEADTRIAAARRLQFLAERARLETELDALRSELATYDAEAELMRAEADLAARTVAVQKADADAWLAALQPIRTQQAEEAATRAQEQAAQAERRQKATAPLATENAKLAKVATELAAQREAAERERAERSQELERLKQQFDGIKKRVEQVGAEESIGALLRSRRAQLIEFSRRHQQRTKSRRDRVVQAQLNGIEYDEQRIDLVEDPAGWLREKLGGEEIVAGLSEATLAEARELREVQRGLLQQLTDGYQGLLDTEIAIETTERQLTTQIAQYRQYVTERVLGIRSSAPMWRLDLESMGRAIAWFGDAPAWAETTAATAGALLEDVWPLVVLLPILLLLALHLPLRRRLASHGEAAARGTNVAYLPTALATIDTVLIVAPLPAAALLLGWRMSLMPYATDLTKAIGSGLVECGLGLLLVLSLRALALPKGLAESHFQWQSTTLAHLRRAAPLLLVAAAPLAFGLGALEATGDDSWLGSLGAVLLLAQLALLAVVTWRLLHPSRGIIGGRFKPVSGAVYRFRKLWFLLAVGTFATLIVMTVLGYEYTAQQLAARVAQTAGLLLGGLTVHALVLRGLLLERRRMQMQRARERVQAAKEGAETAEDMPQQVELDPQSLAKQTQALLGGAVAIVVTVGVFQTWVDVLPALAILRRFQLWDIGPEGAPQWITLADVGLGALVLVGSLAAARNLPALLELLVLQRLRIAAGERNAITTLARYAIVIVGVVWAFSSIGIGWSKVQWLLAAVSVGLGFGLQEIFANFVSGLILLFERPMRVGDLVTVGDTTGRVARIQIRATTILDWNRKELVVPNREFVTGHFVNWTLGDSKVRYIIPVGVAYGSDTKLALQLLKQAALDCERVLKDPEPNAYFVGFGDSTLNLELRLFVDVDTVEWHWTSDVHQAIDAAFRQAGIEIAFPQRDVHLKLPDAVVEKLGGRMPEFGSQP